MKVSYLLGAILTLVLATQLPRILPLVVFRKKIKNEFVQSFLNYMPYGILAAMTFPAILHSTGSLVSAGIGFAVALVLAWRRKGLMTVSLCAVAAVFIAEQVLRLF